MIKEILWIFFGTVFVSLYFSASAQSTYPTCENRSDFNGVISQEILSANQIRKCWSIKVPDGKYARFNLLKRKEYFSDVYFRLQTTGEDDVVLGTYHLNKNFRKFTDVEIFLKIFPNSKIYYASFSFELSYVIEDILCLKNNTYRCSADSCIHDYKVCDWNVDCADGKDERNCDYSIASIAGVNASRSGATSWLKQKRIDSGMWQKYGERAVAALYLADNIGSIEGSCDDQAIAKEMELQTSLALLRNGTDLVTPNELGMLIHALLVTCHDPRRFYGIDLVKLLKNKLNDSDGTHPMANLALCNANESLSTRQVKKLQTILRSNLGHPVLLDVQAVTVMALSCMVRTSENYSFVIKSINSTIQRFVEVQREDGSFGNIYTTALVTQALLGSGQENNLQWRLKHTIKYLLRNQVNNSSFGDFLATCLVLPILNGKSLVDIGNFNCSQKRRTSRDGNGISEITDRLGSALRVKYSLYIGDKPDVVHTLSLRVPLNMTVYEVMEAAAVTDPKYRFETHMTAEMKVYVNSVTGIANDPEAGKFWLLYLEQSQPNGTLYLVTESLKHILIQEDLNIIMWYKTADL